MQFDANRLKPTPNSVSICPACKEKIISKCGSIKIWHWAHESIENCDGNWEPTTQWHLDWQAKVPENFREIIIGKHIADIRLSSGKVIEIQHSNLPLEVMQEREAFYHNLVWIFDGLEFQDRFKLYEVTSQSGNIYYNFRFRKPRHYIVLTTKWPVYIDFGDFVFKVMKFTPKIKSWEGKEYTAWTGYGYKLIKDKNLFRELFGADYAG